MISASLPSSNAYIVSLDIGTSSVRTLLFSGRAEHQPEFGLQLGYRVNTTADGGVEVEGEELLRLCIEAFTHLHHQLEERGIRPQGVAISAFWHSFLGVDESGNTTTPIVHLFDTRSAGAARELSQRVDAQGQHSRTGCVLHPSYWPAKLLWLSQTRARAFDSTKKWLSFGEYLFLKLFGKASTSTSMLSGTGLWDQNLGQYDPEMLGALPIRREQIAAQETWDVPQSALLEGFRANWPLLNGIPWYPAYGDGACNNVGSGCIEPDQFTLMVGTSGAMRAVNEAAQTRIVPGLWCYRVDKKRFVLGGALSNGGNVFEWLTRTLNLPGKEDLESQIAGMEPGAHNLTALSLFAGERSPNWRGDARAAVAGMSLHTSPVEIARATLESVALSFRQIYDIMSTQLCLAKQIVASGGALLHSPGWTQMMADALGHTVIECKESEASSRGAAMLVLEQLGAISNIRDLPAELGQRFEPRPDRLPAYNRLLVAEKSLYRKLFEEK